MAAAAYSRHACGELAAAIAYRVLFAIVPSIALLVAVLDAVLPDTARVAFVEWLLGAFPGTTVESSVEQELANAGAFTSLTGAVALATLLWTASGMTRSLRVALGVVWDTDLRPKFVRAKLRDVAVLGALAALVLAVFLLSLAAQIAVQAGVDLSAALGLGDAADAIARAADLTVIGAATFAALVLVYRLGAPAALAFTDVWRVALVAAVAIDAGLAGYAFYLVNVAGLDTIYGPLGALLALLALLYTAAAIVLFGAELLASPEADDARRGPRVQAAPMTPSYGEPVTWTPAAPRIGLLRLLVSLAILTASVYVAAALVPGVALEQRGAGLLVALSLALLNTVVPPVLAALRLPFMVAIGFIGILLVDAGLLLLVDAVFPAWLRVDGFADALLMAVVMAIVGVTAQVIAGTNDDDEYQLKVTRRIAKRLGSIPRTDVPGLVFLEIDGLALPVLQRALRDGSAPTMARWIADHGYQLAEWETDLSSQTGASQAGILLGSNEDICAFRWVEKEHGRMVVCSSAADCAEIERRHATGVGLLRDGGASRGNLLSGEADESILTVSRIDAEKRANPGYRAFLANGFNVTRLLVLYLWEVVLEWTAAARQKRRDVRPRGHRGGSYPFLRGAMCVFVRDLIVYSVLTDMLRGRPAVYATFASYDEVAHHSGLERADTFEALRKLDQQFARIERARKYAPRPYELIVLSDHGQTQGATFKQRHGYGLDELVERSLSRGRVAAFAGGDEQRAVVGHAVEEATGRDDQQAAGDLSGREAVVLGSGNLGLVYLMESPQRLTLEEIQARHPDLIDALRTHEHIGWLLVRSAEHGAVVLGPAGTRYLDEDRVEGQDPLAPFSPTAALHLRRTDGFAHVADIMVGSFYDPALEEGCAFEELICFHGGLGGAQTRPFILYPPTLTLPPGPIIGAAAVHSVLSGWRNGLQTPTAAVVPSVVS